MNASLAESMIEAACLQMRGKLEEALAELCSVRDRGESSAKLSCAIGHLHFELGQFDAARRIYEELGDTGDPGGAALRDIAGFNLAVCHEKMGEYERAAACFEKSIAADSRRTGAYLGLGIALLHIGHAREALEALEICLERQPFREAALRGKAVALQLLGRHGEALELLEKLLVRDPRSEELLSNAIVSAMALGDYQRMMACGQRLLELDPASRPALECLAAAAAASRDYEEAVRLCRLLVQHDPENLAGWFNCGVALQKAGRPEEAAEAFAQAVRLDPQPVESHLSLGTVLHELEQWDAARAAYERALALDGANRIALWNLALLSERQAHFAEAEKRYAALLEHHPDAEEAWFRLGYARLERGNYAGCIEALNRCPLFQKKSPEALLNLGIAYWKLGKFEAAREAMRQILSFDPKSEGALRCLAAMALESKDYDQALKLHERLLEQARPPASALYNCGLLLQKKGRLAGAADCYKRALAEQPVFPQAALNLGHALMGLGKHEEAHASWQAAMRGNGGLAEQFLV